ACVPWGEAAARGVWKKESEQSGQQDRAPGGQDPPPHPGAALLREKRTGEALRPPARPKGRDPVDRPSWKGASRRLGRRYPTGTPARWIPAPRTPTKQTAVTADLQLPAGIGGVDGQVGLCGGRAQRSACDSAPLPLAPSAFLGFLRFFAGAPKSRLDWVGGQGALRGQTEWGRAAPGGCPFNPVSSPLSPLQHHSLDSPTDPDSCPSWLPPRRPCHCSSTAGFVAKKGALLLPPLFLPRLLAPDSLS
ncbi:hypothetical protein HPG69_018686, partial [Diceros bicornis minor]